MKNKTLHMIGNAHLDPVWLWQWQEGYQEANATFRSVLNLMKESPDFRFTSSSAGIYEWIEGNDPGMFEEIRQRAAEGRWEIAGGWWIQPDCNLPGGESFVRQGLYGQRYFKAKLGVTATVGYNVDSFGHNGMLPQILLKSGMTRYVFMRPGPHEKDLPARLFWWESDDGSRVLAYRIPHPYCTWGEELDEHVRSCMDALQGSPADTMCFYGVGNHGGGPTRRNLESIRRMDQDAGFPRLVLSTPSEFFCSVASDGAVIPVVHDDLQHHASGCYAAHSGIKRWNRQAEHLLLAAEKWSTVAQLVTGQPYPGDLDRAWKNVLFNQFHDILAGTSLEPAYNDARDTYGEAMAIAGRGLNTAIQSLAWNIHIEPEEDTRPIIVFNPHSWACKLSVEVELGRLHDTDILIDEEGRQVSLQAVRSLATVAGGRNRLCFVAELPAMGYRVYRVAPRPSQVAFPVMVASETAMENDWYRLELDEDTGYISRLYDRQRGVEVFQGVAAWPVVIADPSDTWSHGVLHFDDIVGEFKSSRIRRIEHGPVKSVIRVESVYGDSRLTQDFTVYRELKQIDVHVTVDWRERFKMLKLRFPVDVHAATATYEIPYGHIVRPANGEEEPGQSWVDLSGVAGGTGEPYGLSVLNDGKYSFDVAGNVLSLTVLRSPIYAHHEPYVPTPDGVYTFVDQGIQRFTYTLLPHAESWQQAGTVKRAWELNQQPVALLETYHPGPLPPKDSYLSLDQDNLIASVLKRGEDGDDTVIRCYETGGKVTHGVVRLPKWDRVIEAGFGPCEIKTFRVPSDPSSPVIETDLIEWTDSE